MKANQIITKLEDWISPKLIDTWDRTGFQIGEGGKEVKGILLALDITREVVNTALDYGCNMIITHHPFIFSPIESITDKTYKGRLIKLIIKNDLVIYNAHSNLDLVEGGVNDVLAELLHLKMTIPIKPIFLDLLNNSDKEYGYGRVGAIDEISLKELIDRIKTKLDIDYLKVYGETAECIKKVAICGGSGSEFILDAKEKGAQVYITGDIKYHDAQLAYEEDIVLIDATHYHTEKVILEELKKRLIDITDNNTKIRVYDKMTFPYKFQ
ncbi:MAG: Nif3-like dinuclear metal center hexameric protein [Gudongella sp.]|nr:Nif3-like dinuclear metal center hexameric protein [Gudongella sp.]